MTSSVSPGSPRSSIERQNSKTNLTPEPDASSISRGVTAPTPTQPPAAAAAAPQPTPQTPQTNIEERVMKAAFVSKKTKQFKAPQKHGYTHYALKWGGKRTKEVLGFVKSGMSFGKAVNVMAGAGEALNALAGASGGGAIAVAGIGSTLKTAEELHKVLKSAKNVKKVLERRREALNEVSKYRDNAENQTDPAEKQKLEHLACVATLLAKRQTRARAFVALFSGTAGLGSMLTASTGAVLLQASVIGIGTMGAIASSATGVGLVVPAAAMGLCLYETIKYARNKKKENFWEYTLHVADKAATGAPQGDNEKNHLDAVKARLLKKGSLPAVGSFIGKAGDEDALRIKQVAFNQCLQNSNNFAIEFLIETLKEEYLQKNLQPGTNEYPPLSAHKLLETMGLEKGNRHVQGSLDIIEKMLVPGEDPEGFLNDFLRKCLGLPTKTL